MPEPTGYERVMRLVDDELERVRDTRGFDYQWWEFRRKRWLDGVRTARACSETELWKIKSALIDLAAHIDGDVGERGTPQ